MAKKETTIVGLDIGSANIRAVQLNFKSSPPTIEKVAEIPLPPDAIRDGLIMEREIVVEALRMLWKANKFSTNVVRLGVGGHNVISRLAELDWENDKDFAVLLPSQVKTHLIIDPNEYIIDFHTLSEYMQRRKIARDSDVVSYRGTRNSETEVVEIPKKHVLIVAASKTMVQDYVDVALEAKLKPVSVDIKSLALLRAFSAEPSPGEEPVADVSIDIGANETTIIVHKLGQPLFTRTLQDSGGRTITMRLQGELGLSFPRAEKRKMNVFYENTADQLRSQVVEEWSFNAFDSNDESTLSKIDATRGSVERTDDEEDEYDLSIEEAKGIVQEEVAALIDEIRNTLNWFRSESGSTDFEGFSTFVLSGAGAGIPSLVERLTSEFKTESVLASMSKAKSSGRAIPPEIAATEHEYATAYGLALGQGSTYV